MNAPAPDVTSEPPADPLSLLRERSYLVLLVFGAVVGAPVAFVAYCFLQLVTVAQHWIYTALPSDLGFDATPDWWAVPVLAVAGLIVAATITYLRGIL